jgi:hypothetical protein
MRRALAILLTIPLATLLTSCATLLPGTTLLSSTTQDLTGNWIFGVSDPPAGTPPLNAFIGAINGQGASFTATFHATGACISPTQTLNFTGTQNASGAITLTSTNFPNNTATITATVLSVNGVASGLGALAITGTGPCAIPSISMILSQFPPLTGTYTGTLTSTTNTTAVVTANLAQASANSSGQFPESGTVIVTAPGCTSTFTLTGLITGPTLAASLSSTSGPTATAVASAVLSPASSQPPLPITLNILSTGCNTGSFNGSLTRQ